MPRRPAPLRLKLAKGRGRSRDSGGRLIGAPPAFTRYLPERPDNLSPEGLSHWDDITGELARLELVSPAMVGGLVALCETFAMAERARQAVLEEGATVPGPRGVPRRNPNLVTWQNALAEYRAWCDEFGLTPSAEGRLGIKDRAPSDGRPNPFAGPVPR